MRRFSTTVTIQRTGELDGTSFTGCTKPVSGEPLTANIVFKPLYGQSEIVAPILDQSSRRSACSYLWSRHAKMFRD
jgi:hypothetical protein